MQKCPGARPGWQAAGCGFPRAVQELDASLAGVGWGKNWLLCGFGG